MLKESVVLSSYVIWWCLKLWFFRLLLHNNIYQDLTKSNYSPIKLTGRLCLDAVNTYQQHSFNFSHLGLFSFVSSRIWYVWVGTFSPTLIPGFAKTETAAGHFHFCGCLRNEPAVILNKVIAVNVQNKGNSNIKSFSRVLDCYDLPQCALAWSVLLVIV